MGGQNWGEEGQNWPKWEVGQMVASTAESYPLLGQKAQSRGVRVCASKIAGTGLRALISRAAPFPQGASDGSCSSCWSATCFTVHFQHSIASISHLCLSDSKLQWCPKPVTSCLLSNGCWIPSLKGDFTALSQCILGQTFAGVPANDPGV